MHIITNFAIYKGFSPPSDKRLEIDYIRYYKKTNCCQNVNILCYSDLNLNSDPDFYNFICGENIEINGSDITIQSDKKLDLVAKNEIVLLPGFTSELGSDFLAKIDPSLYNKKSLNVASIENNKLNYKIINNNDINCFENINVKDSINIKVYPNPAKGIINIEIPFNINDTQYIKLINSLGITVFSKINIEENNFQIDISKYTKGIYLIKVYNGNNIITEKIILQ